MYLKHAYRNALQCTFNGLMTPKLQVFIEKSKQIKICVSNIRKDSRTNCQVARLTNRNSSCKAAVHPAEKQKHINKLQKSYFYDLTSITVS